VKVPVGSAGGELVAVAVEVAEGGTVGMFVASVEGVFVTVVVGVSLGSTSSRGAIVVGVEADS
jgi:hypothetical protein